LIFFTIKFMHQYFFSSTKRLFFKLSLCLFFCSIVETNLKLQWNSLLFRFFGLFLLIYVNFFLTKGNWNYLIKSNNIILSFVVADGFLVYYSFLVTFVVRCFFFWWIV
jgi:hypothetical protein